MTPVRLTADSIRGYLSRTPRQIVDRPEFRRAAVLVPFVLNENTWHFLLTRRTDHVEHHKGQVSFPGGAMEEGEQPEETALRESFEEIGLARERVTLLGCLDDIWTPSGYVVTPVVGIVEAGVVFSPNPGEVSLVFTVPVEFFTDQRNSEKKRVHVNGHTRDVFFYSYQSETIWGATAFIIRNALHRLELLAAEP